MLRGRKASLLVCVRHGREETPHDLEFRIEFGEIRGHFEHAQVEVCNGREGATGNEHQRGFRRVIHAPLQSVGREIVSRQRLAGNRHVFSNDVGHVGIVGYAGLDDDLGRLINVHR